MLEVGGADACTLCARSGHTDDHKAANQRFLACFCKHFLEVVPTFLEDDLGALHVDSVMTYLGEAELTRLLHRAAQLKVGLLPDSAQHLALLQRIENAVSRQMPMLHMTLPAFTRRYL